MREALKNPKVLILLVLLLFSFLSLGINGLELGIDFKGGTIFQVQLESPAPPDKLETISLVIAERLDAFGLKDTKVNSLGEDSISAQIAETDPEKIEQLESLLKTQGKFEATFKGDLLFEGSDILNVSKDPAQGYGVTENVSSADPNATVSGWMLPFVLSQKAGENFSRMVFHQCTPVSYDVAAGAQYDCDKTYFFIDRPTDSVLVIPSDVFSNDSALLNAGNSLENIPEGTSIDDLLLNATVPYFVIDSNGLSEEQLSSIASLSEEKTKAIVHSSVSEEDREKLEGLGFSRVVEGDSAPEGVPWIWVATGARQIISITPGIANLDPYVENPENAKVFSNLVITGSSSDAEDAKRELKEITVLLETGSLPIPIKSISKETISPFLGQEFLISVLFIGIVALIVVSLIIFFRYRKLSLVIPILFTGASEIILILGFASFFKINLDLAAIAGILAAIGTGVDHQIIISDELLRGGGSHAGEVMSFVNRISRAFFIIAAAVATTIVTMFPLILFGFGFGKLRGFAITIVLGALIGVFITRRAFSVIVEDILNTEKSEN